MKTLGVKLGVLLLSAFLVAATVVSAPAADKAKGGEGYDVRLSGTKIELVFPDGSVLSTPVDFSGKEDDLGRLEATDGMASELLGEALQQMGLQQSPELPKAFSLSQNSPNPFNPSTTISYTVPEDSEVRVKLNVYNLRGQLVTSLVDELQPSGTYHVNWDGSDSSGRRVSSGVYFYRLVAGDYVATRKMVVLK